MKTRNILSNLFNFLLAFSILAFAGANPTISLLIAGIVTFALNYVPAMGGFLSGFITNGSEYNGKELTDIILRPILQGQLAKDMGVRVFLAVKSSVKLTFFGPMTKIVKAYADGWTGGNAADKLQKKLTLAEFKAEAQYSKQAYKNTILEEITNRGGIAQNDITGTVVHTAEVTVFMNAVQEDVRRIFWLGDTAKKTVTSGFHVDATGDVNYNVINGIWKSVIAQSATSPTADQIKRIAMSNGTVAQVATHTLTGTSGTANIQINGTNYLATFTTNLTTSAANFVTSHAATLLALGVTVTSSGVDVILTSSIAGQPFLTIAGINVTGDLDSTLVATTANTPAAALATDEAIDTFNLMMVGASAVFKAFLNKLANRGVARLWVTDTMLENYRQTLEAFGTEAANKITVDGQELYTYRGIPLMPMGIDSYLSADFISPYPHRALLSVPNNLALVLNGSNDDSEVKMWFNPDENVNRQRAQFEFGADFILPEYCIIAY